MHNDNIYPGRGEPFVLTTPTKQKSDEEAKLQATLAQLPLLQETVDKFDERIAFYDSVNSVPDEVTTDPEAFMHVIAANKLTRDNLIAERDIILQRVKEAQA